MPNYETNIITMPSEIIKKYLSTNSRDEIYFDFNKLIPMPEDIRYTICGSMENKAIYVFLESLKETDQIQFDHYLQDPLIKLTYNEICDRVKLNTKEDAIEYRKDGHLTTDVLYGEGELVDRWKDLSYSEVGKLYCENALKYGCMDWYGWANENWGTKWNSCDTSYYPEEDPDRIQFDTAWAAPYPIAEKLINDNPDVEIEWEHYGEDYHGCYVIAKDELGVFYDHSVDDEEVEAMFRELDVK